MMRTASAQHPKEIQQELVPWTNVERTGQSSELESREVRSKAGHLAVENGKMFEGMIREIFNFKKSKSHSKDSKPDIFDLGRGALAEIKATLEKDRVLIFMNQLGKYIKLAENTNRQRPLYGEKLHISAYFVIGFFDKGDSGVLLRDVYILGDEQLQVILNDHLLSEQKTKWSLKIKDPKLLAKINNIEEKEQTLFSVKKAGEVENVTKTKEELRADLLKKNSKGGYVRLYRNQARAESCQQPHRLDLDGLCPKLLTKNCKGKYTDYEEIPIVFHYSKSTPLPESEWPDELKKAKVRRP